MARKNTARAESVVTLNGKAAENALNGLKIKAKQYRDAILEASRAGDATKVEKLNNALRSMESSMKSIKQQTYDYNAVLKNLNGSTMVQLEKAAKSLRNELKGLSPATTEFVNKSKQLDSVRARLDELNGKVRQNQNWLGRMGDSFNRYWQLGTAVVASVVGASLAFRGAAQVAAEMDDVYANVMKTTGLTRDQVVELNKEFDKLKTRTTREDLNALAHDAGKLGISAMEDVKQFVTAANQINVALGEDLGEGAIKNIGKISEVFQKTKELGIEKAFLSIGSAINALGQASTADESYLVDFTQRLSGVAYQSGMSVQNLLGFASALDQTGNKVEMAATAMQKLIMSLFSDTSRFAKIAGVDVKEFSNLMSTDVNGALILVLTKLKEKGGFAQLVPIFKDMGLDGARAVSVLTSMASNIGLVTEAQKLSNLEYERATSLTNEYNVKNSTRMAKLDIAKKAFQAQVIVLGEQLSPAFLKTTNGATVFLKVIMAIPAWLYAVIAVAVASIAVWKVWNGVVAVGNTLMTAARMVTLAYSAAMALAQGNTIRAAAAWKMLNATFSATALGAIVVLVGAIGIGIYKWVTYQSELTKATKSFFAETQKTKAEAEGLLSIIENAVIGSQEYKDAIAKLTEIYGPYITGLIDEKGVLTDIEKARLLINKSIEQTIGLRLREETISNVTTESLGKQARAYEDIVQTLMEQGNLSEDVARMQANNFANSIKQGRSWKAVTNDLLSTVNNGLHIGHFKTFADEYGKMMEQIDATNKQFDFLATPATPEQAAAVAAAESAKAAALNLEQTEEALKAAQEAHDKAFKASLVKLDMEERELSIFYKKQLLQRSISTAEYEAQTTMDTIAFLAKRNELYIKYGQDNTTSEAAYLDAMIKQYQSAHDKVMAMFKEEFKERKTLSDKNEDKIRNEVTIKTTKNIAPIFDTAKEDAARFIRFQELEKEAEQVKQNFINKSWKLRKKVEKQNLDDMLKKNLITQKEYESAVQDMKIRNTVEASQKINSIVQSMADFYSAVKEAEFDKLESEKQKELSLAGDNADQRQEIEERYEQKKLELQQEYADKDMAVKIVQAIAAGALAIVQAFAQLGPIAGAIAGGLIAATTAFQISSIVQQRNALKNTSISSSTGTQKTRSVKGFSSGGYTGSAQSDSQAVGIVHANEWVAPARMVRSLPVVFANLEKARVSRYAVGSPPRQFASGGYTTPTNNKTDELLNKLILEVRGMKEKPFKSFVVQSELNAANELNSRVKKLGSL